MQRIILLVLAVVVSVPVMLKNRSAGSRGAPTTFSDMTGGSFGNVVRIRGDVRHPGIYPLSANELPYSVINMALPLRPFRRLSSGAHGVRNVRNGDDLRIRIMSDGRAFIAYSTLPARQRLQLGIPLDINQMSETDFDSLPGIGSQMAKRIVEYRQNNGGSMRVEGLKQIEGIGDKRYSRLYQYFQLP